MKICEFYTVLFLVLIFALQVSSAEDCWKNLFINELRFGDRNIGTDYGEIIHFPSKATSQLCTFSKYKVVIVSTDSRGLPEITFELNLNNAQSVKSRQWLLTLANADSLRPDFNVTRRAVYVGKPLKEFMPKSAAYPFGVFVVCSAQAGVRDQLKVIKKRTRKEHSIYTGTSLSASLELVLASHTENVIFYGREPK